MFSLLSLLISKSFHLRFGCPHQNGSNLKRSYMNSILLMCLPYVDGPSWKGARSIVLRGAASPLESCDLFRLCRQIRRWSPHAEVVPPWIEHSNVWDGESTDTVIRRLILSNQEKTV